MIRVATVPRRPGGHWIRPPRVVCNRSSRRAASTTSAPACASAFANATPSPISRPVTATRPSSRKRVEDGWRAGSYHECIIFRYVAFMTPIETYVTDAALGMVSPKRTRRGTIVETPLGRMLASTERRPDLMAAARIARRWSQPVDGSKCGNWQPNWASTGRRCSAGSVAATSCSPRSCGHSRSPRWPPPSNLPPATAPNASRARSATSPP